MREEGRRAGMAGRDERGVRRLARSEKRYERGGIGTEEGYKRGGWLVARRLALGWRFTLAPAVFMLRWAAGPSPRLLSVDLSVMTPVRLLYSR